MTHWCETHAGEMPILQQNQQIDIARVQTAGLPVNTGLNIV